MSSSSRAISALEREQRGADAFLLMFRSWMTRSGWSLAVMADLCDAATRQSLVPDVLDYEPGQTYAIGDVVVHQNFVWQCGATGSCSAVPGEAMQEADETLNGWQKLASLRRLHPTQLHNLQRGAAKQLSPTTFVTLGALNLYLADLRAKRAAPPATKKLVAKASESLVIEDQDGPWGPEEFFSCFVGRLEPPLSVTAMTQEEANDRSRELARKIRDGFQAAGLDLVDDWAVFASRYPTTNRERLAKIKDVALSKASWAADQIEDEEGAVGIALGRLAAFTEQAARSRAVAGNS